MMCFQKRFEDDSFFGLTCVLCQLFASSESLHLTRNHCGKQYTVRSEKEKMTKRVVQYSF